jgi:hypothetical protein
VEYLFSCVEYPKPGSDKLLVVYTSQQQPPEGIRMELDRLISLYKQQKAFKRLEERHEQSLQMQQNVPPQ